MRIAPPTLFWILIAGILAADRFLPLFRFTEPWLPWSGAAMVSATLAALILGAAFAVAVRYWYIAYEEAAMRRRFGERYAAYCRRVGRWLGRRRNGGNS